MNHRRQLFRARYNPFTHRWAKPALVRVPCYVCNGIGSVALKYEVQRCAACAGTGLETREA